jgi:nicotinamidase-related amidase
MSENTENTENPTRALVVIDVQESFRARPTWAEVSTPDIADRVSRLVEAARTRGDAVFWVLHTEPGTGGVFDPESGHVRLQEPLKALPGEPVFRKTSINAFTTTNLAQKLTTLGIRHLTICGIQTERCCETTTRVASDLGYQVDFVTEATATFPITHPDTGRVLPADQVIERTEFALHGRFATVRTLEDALAG